MCRFSLKARPIPATRAPRPDFIVTSPTVFYVEVSTLNVSEAEKTELQTTGGVNLNHRETLRRLLIKCGVEKNAQAAYAAGEGRPCILVLFDYSSWSSLATNRYHFLADALLGEERAFLEVPVALSAIVYAERRVNDGHIAISNRRSAIYYNPAALYRFAVGHFSMLHQFGTDLGSVGPKAQEDWIALER